MIQKNALDLVKEALEISYNSGKEDTIRDINSYFCFAIYLKKNFRYHDKHRCW